MLNFSFSQQDLQTILKALGAMPLSESLQTFLNLQNQLAKLQQQPAPNGTVVPPLDPALPGEKPN